MSEAQLPAPLHAVFDEITGVIFKRQGARRLRVDIDADRLPTLLALLKGRAGYLHLSAISCVDWPQDSEFELVYHLGSYETQVMVAAHIRIPRAASRYLSVYDIHIPAGFFERDIHEMYGIEFEGSPNMTPFILTEWQGPPPMRKDFDTLGYVNQHYSWQQYDPQWLRELEARGGGLVE